MFRWLTGGETVASPAEAHTLGRVSPLLTSLLVSACLGALIGLVRQWREQSKPESDIDLGGVRTYTLWAMLGCLSAYASRQFFLPVIAVTLVLVGVQQIASVVRAPGQRTGTTSFASALITVFVGALVFWQQREVAIVLSAATMVLIGVKQPIHSWTRAFNAADIRATLQFVAISGVILPLVPNREMGPYAAFNPYDTWMMVVLISGVGFAGYIAVRLLGAGAGLLLTSVLGGLASSTATTLTFSRRSKEDSEQSLDYSMAVVTASTVMLPRTLVIVAIISPALAKALLLPLAITAVPGLAFIIWWWFARHHRTKTNEVDDSPTVRNPLQLSTAIKFALLYSAIAFGVKALTESGHAGGTLPLSFVSGLTDMAAIALSMARNAADQSIPLRLATHAIVLAAISNSLLKAGLAIGLGSPQLRKLTALVLGLTAAAGAVAMFFAPAA